MNLGICVKKSSDNVYMYSKPFIMNIDSNNTFIAQILRDIDFSFYADIGEAMEISIILYPNKNSYFEANKNKYTPNKFKVLGTYNIVFDEITDKYQFNDVTKGTLVKKIDNIFKLEIIFRVFQDNKQYIMSTPSISGLKEYLLGNHHTRSLPLTEILPLTEQSAPTGSYAKYVGICIKKLNDNVNMFCKPFIMNTELDDIFIGQILRDIDFSFYVVLYERMEISIILYPEKTSYYDANKYNYSPNKFKVLGTYNIVFDEITEKHNCDTFTKGVLSKKIDNNLKLNITFSAYKDNTMKKTDKYYNNYILSNPTITGLKEYLKR